MLLKEKLKGKKILLASKSPRRHYLLKELGLEFELFDIDVDEDYPDKLKRESIPLFLSKLKAEAAKSSLNEHEIVITADTIVWIGDMVLNKPKDLFEAKLMLNRLSGKMHEVITAVSINSTIKTTSFYVVTEVWFKSLRAEEIDYYVEQFKPLDKAGAYGAQEWIGYIGVEKMNGSYFNVMGLPLHELYEELLVF
jgi:septum formation protein